MLCNHHGPGHGLFAVMQNSRCYNWGEMSCNQGLGVTALEDAGVDDNVIA